MLLSKRKHRRESEKEQARLWLREMDDALVVAVGEGKVLQERGEKERQGKGVLASNIVLFDLVTGKNCRMLHTVLHLLEYTPHLGWIRCSNCAIWKAF